MKCDIVKINVHLIKKGGATDPRKGTLFVYELETQDYTELKVDLPGNIITRDVKTSPMKFKFVLQTKEMEWNGIKYAVSFENPSAKDPAEALWISKLAKPTGPWKAQGPEFSNFTFDPDSTCLNDPKEYSAVYVTMDDAGNKNEDFWYAPQVNYIAAGNATIPVRDDPQIKNGPPVVQREFPIDLIVVGFGALVIGLVGIVVGRLTRR